MTVKLKRMTQELIFFHIYVKFTNITLILIQPVWETQGYRQENYLLIEDSCTNISKYTVYASQY